MTETLKSFQNCKETDIPGYNDCPSFLFQISKKTSGGRRQQRLVTPVRDLYGNTNGLPSMPPPPMKRKTSDSLNDVSDSNTISDVSMSESSTSISTSATSNSSFTNLKSMNEIEIKEKINNILTANTILSEKEFQFYKKKIDLNLNNSISQETTRNIITEFFQLQENKLVATNYLRKWMINDVTIANWCPAFLKIFENIDEQK